MNELVSAPEHMPLAEAFEAHYADLVRTFLLVTGHLDVAEDLVQEGFVRAADAVEVLPIEAVRPYLRATIMNLWRNRLRRLALERREHMLTSPSANGEASIEDRDALWAAIKRLPNRQRSCLVLRYYEDLTERETARVLRCSLGTVKSQTSRALKRLRKELHNERHR